jgi:hypothetical protein
MNLSFVQVRIPFPLTRTLSLREREQLLADLRNSNDVRFADRLATVLPLLGERAGVRASV